MNALMEFAAARKARMEGFDFDLEPFVATALVENEWDDVLSIASQMWVDVFTGIAPEDDVDQALSDFIDLLETALAKTTPPGAEGPDRLQVEAVARYISTAVVNDATLAAAKTTAGAEVQWVTMHDSEVRTSHNRADGQIRGANERFDVGGARLRYPGDPTGPIEEVINCRCVLAPVTDRLRRENMAAAAPAPVIDEDVDAPDDDAEVETEIQDEDLVDDQVDVPWHAVLAPEDTPTGDGRMFAKDSLTWRDLPLPLLYQHATDAGHGGAVRVGRIDEVWKTEDGIVRARGVFNGTPEAQHVIDGILDGSIRGTSIDADNIAIDYAASTMDPEELNGGTTIVKAARIAGLTIVAIPAYQEAYIALGDAFDDELTPEDHAVLAACGCSDPIDDELSEQDHAVLAAVGFAVGTKDGPGWITNPKATARIRRYWTHGKGAAKIRWGVPGDFNRCRRQLAKYVANPEWLAGTCANMHKEALGLWPGMERGGRHSNTLTAAVPAVTLVAAAETVSATAFADPRLEGPTPIQIDGDRIYGHLATWGVCHIGIPGVCTTAPRSAQGYAYFHTGAVYTADGAIPVGHITMDTGHAPITAGSKVAAGHYDHTGYVVADVAAGEDAHGIWVAGVLRPGVGADRRQALAAAALSGDWREIGGNLELVAALAVNVPGFPIPRTQLAASGGVQDALVAAGIVERGKAVYSADEIAAIARTAVDEYRHQERRDARAAAVKPARERLRELRLQRVRYQIQKVG